jgi:uncharacterized protein YndB with AHSA1/START domain
MTKPVDVTLPDDMTIRVTRAFDAPRDLIFDCHTKPELMKKWLLGPPGWTMPVCDVDLRVGGKYRHVWRSDADGSEFAIGGLYREIAAPERLVTLEHMEGMEGNALNTLELDEAAGRTTLTVTMQFATKEARDGALASGMTDGMAMSYDRMEAVILEAA